MLPLHAVLDKRPFQPSVDKISPQRVGTNNPRILRFQPSWFQRYPWLHYRADLHGVLCFVCSRADSLRLVDLAMKREPAFMSAGS